MKKIHSQVIPLTYSDVNTDLIIPAKYLTTLVKKGLGEYLFIDVRKMDASFPLNFKKYQAGKILVTRRNFGCGSSREHAAWSIVDFGIRVVIAPSFADIFYSNAIKNQLLPIVLEEEIIEHMFAAEKKSNHYKLDVDLEEQKVTLPDGTSHSFDINGYDKYALINEIDNIDYLLLQTDKIKAFDKKHAKHIFLDTEALYKK